LDAALKGDTVNTTGTYRTLPAETAPAIAGRYATMAALAHVVAGRRRLRSSLSAIPPGRARADAIRRIPVLADLVADLRKLEEATDTDHVAEAKRLTRRADSRHGEPDIAIKLYRRALSEAPDHGPAYYGLFLLQRELGEIEEAARNLSTAIHFSPGNRVFRYYQQTWIQADPSVAQFFPTTVGAGDSRLATGVHHPTVVHESGSFAVKRSIPLDDPGEVRELFDTMLEREEHEPILKLTAEAWGELSADEVREPLATSLRIMAHVSALAHIDLALGFLLDATKAFEAAGPESRLRQIAAEVCIDTIVEM
jgi:tetratricopeptide (TPR) repeat protein